MADWISETFNQLGYWGIALAMLLENVFPPVPSEAILPGAGMAARRGDLSLIGVIAAASAGSLLGAVLWYLVGLWIGTERLRQWADRQGKYFGVSAQDVDRADAWFDRWGGAAVFVGRLVPGVRTLISVPAGLAEMPFLRFLACTTAGTVLWSALLVLVGWWLGESAEMVEEPVSWAGIAVVAALLIWGVRRVVGARRHARDTNASRQEPNAAAIESRTDSRTTSTSGSSSATHGE